MKSNSKEITEIATNIISEGTLIEGEVHFDHITRVHGVLRGDVVSKEGGILILAETGVIEGNVIADTLFVDGFIRGDVKAKTKVTVSGMGRVVGNIDTPSLEVEFGAHFEGQCKMNQSLVPASSN